MRKSDAFTALEGFNIGICALAGAGRGIDTPLEAVQRYNNLMRQHQDELVRLLEAAEAAPDATLHRYYLDGLRHVAVRSCA